MSASAARTTPFQDLTDIGIGTSGNGVGTDASQLNFAWALHAGLSYAVTQNFSVELAYRYLSYGSVTDEIDCTAAATQTPTSSKT